MKIVFLKILAAALCAVALLAFVSCGGTVGSGSSESDRPQNGSGYPKDNEDEASGALKVISYNVLVEWCSEYNGENTGITKKYDYSRIDRLVALIKELQPDSFGTQECSLSIKNDILAGLDNYGCVGTMDTGEPDAADAFGTFIFYRKDKYNVVESENFWLTDTPDKVSTYPGADRPRNGVYAVLENNDTAAKYGHVNVHLEWKSRSANKKGAEVTRSFCDKLLEKGYPVFCTGDFNLEKSNYKGAEIMTEDGRFDNSYDIAEIKTGQSYTHYDYVDWAIDYVFTSSGNISVKTYKTIGDYEISDHLGVMVTAEFS